MNFTKPVFTALCVYELFRKEHTLTAARSLSHDIRPSHSVDIFQLYHLAKSFVPMEYRTPI